jgi:hypothetical protein
MVFRRFAVIATTVAVLCAGMPAPSLAISTQQEIEIGKEYDKQITEQSVIVTDPLLVKWTNDIGQRLWAQTARKDVTYSIKIIDENDINAFSTLGGYIYINSGTLDFAQSDDELAGVIGHETGHIERRHVITSSNKATITNIIFGIASLFSPIIYQFGSMLQAGVQARISRDDENEADKYGVMIMSRAGYDPEAMRSFMAHLGAVEREDHDALSKYLADHPGTAKRLANLNGDEGLNPQTRTDDQRLAAAVHDLDTARYSVAAIELSDFEKRHPTDATAQFQLGQAQLALGQVAKGEQNLTASAQSISPQAKQLADVRVKHLRDAERRLDLLHPDLTPLRARLLAAQSDDALAATSIVARRKDGLDQLKVLSSRIERVEEGFPNNLGNITPKKGSRLEALLHNVALMAKSIGVAQSKSGEVLAGVGSMAHGKESGLLKVNNEIYEELGDPLKLDNPPPQATATFSSYPAIFENLGRSDADMVRAVDASRASLALLDVGMGDFDNFIHELTGRVMFDRSNDLTEGSYKEITPSMTRAVDGLNRAAVGASQAEQLYDMARSRQLETRIDLLGLTESPDRYATLEHALDVRFGSTAPDFDTLTRSDLTPGAAVAAVIVGADTNAAPQAILAEAKATNKSIVDVANARGMSAMSLEIFLGLVYLDYTDDPAKEAGDAPKATPATL